MQLDRTHQDAAPAGKDRTALYILRYLMRLSADAWASRTEIQRHLIEVYRYRVSVLTIGKAVSTIEATGFPIEITVQRNKRNCPMWQYRYKHESHE